MTTQHRPNVLIVDDDINLCEALVDLFQGAGFDAQFVTDGRSMRLRLSTASYSLMLIDLRLRDEDGMLLAQEVRSRSSLPIIMLTGQGDQNDRIRGLETAIDHFLAKPFDNRELVARSRALIRRSNEFGAFARAARWDLSVPERFRFGHWIVNVSARSLTTADGERAPLTDAEFSLLEVLIRSPNRVLSREDILAAVHGAHADLVDRSIDVLVLRLRRKIEQNPSVPVFIKTERGLGYRFSAQVSRC